MEICTLSTTTMMASMRNVRFERFFFLFSFFLRNLALWKMDKAKPCAPKIEKMEKR